MVLVKMESWSKHTPPWTRFGLLAIIAIAFITGNNATFVDEFFDTEPEVKELVDAEKGITYKGLSGEINLEHPSRRTKRSFYNKGRAWMFLNIPYAEPLNSTTVFQPSLYLTDKRFNETMAKRHKDEINIRRFGNFCPQSESDLTGLYKKYCYSEMAIDCLNLNVFSPVLDPPSNDTFPVYVLLHGGKLSQGSSCDFGRHGVIQNFVLQKVVVVTVNYRLGIYGMVITYITPTLNSSRCFMLDTAQANATTQNINVSDFFSNLSVFILLAFCYLRTTENEKEKTDSNRGLSDQIEALYWVNKHIHIFNGDNERVTLGGFEAGACSAALIAISEAKSALFNNVILHGSSLENCANGSVLVQENPKIEYSMEVIANDIALHNNLTEKFPLGMQMSSAKYVGNKDYHVPIEDKARSNSAANHKSKQLLTINRQDAHTQKPLNVIVGINHDELVALDNKINYAVSNQNELRAFFSKYLNLPNKWLNEALDEVFKAYKGKDDETTAMKRPFSGVFVYKSAKNNVIFLAITFPRVSVSPVPHGSDFRYAYLPLHYWQTIHDADDTTLFEAEQNVSQHLSNILLSLIMGNLSSFAVPCYSGEIRNGTFLEISGSQSTKLNVSDNLLTKEKYDAWTRFYGKKNFPPAEDIFPFMIETTLNNNDTKIELFWNINWQKRRVDFKFQLTGNTELHFLVGFSDHGKYENSDGCYYSQTSSGDGNMKDYWVDNDLTLRVDLHQDCIFHKEKTNETEGLFYFSRKFLTCDPRDYNIEEGTTNILFAIGPKQIKNLNDSGVSYQMKYTQLLQEPVDIPPPTETNTSYVDLRAPNITIPKQRTTYWYSALNCII
ncbi:carboxylesterase family domain-containing protein [Ditylenchus destructor]|uniref:Carboxylesterase family domain-containing protein n=1 Tax=Ditylenchus destructor TaxID=166010 RepID=A0AAD4R131_9BILA|nr:carboxylesterase family domain-containing protein [Ditylenchus destructor]